MIVLEAREKIITDYFNSWLKKDVSVLKNTFTTDALYIESWESAYKSLLHITKWFNEWNKDNAVLQWTLKRFFHQDNACVCEWFFQCDCNREVYEFDGVSIVEFNADNKITMLKEFQSKIPNRYPYE